MELPCIIRPWLLSCALRCTKCLSIKPQVGPKFQIEANCLRHRTHFRHHPRHLFCSKRWCQLPGGVSGVTAWKKASKDASQYSHDFPGSWPRKSFDKDLSNDAWNNDTQKWKGWQCITWPLEMLWGCRRLAKKHDMSVLYNMQELIGLDWMSAPLNLTKGPECRTFQ